MTRRGAGMTRIFIIVLGAALFLVANVALVIWIVVLGMIKDWRLRKLPAT
jgi:hypothetical protein